MKLIHFVLSVVPCAAIIIWAYLREQRTREKLTDEENCNRDFNILKLKIGSCDDTLSYWECDVEVQAFEEKYEQKVGYGFLFQYTQQLADLMKEKSYLNILQ